MKLITIQNELKAPKNQNNKFGGYKYRSCEDILEALKPLLFTHKCHLIINDEVVEVGGRVYVKATATLHSCEKSDLVKWSASAYAREAESKKGMDEAQVTGSASSYARKYALNGLFAIDDTKDADTMDNSHQPKPQKTEPQKPKPEPVDAKLKFTNEIGDAGKKWFEIVVTIGKSKGQTLSDLAANGETAAIEGMIKFLKEGTPAFSKAKEHLEAALAESKNNQPKPENE